MTASPSFHIDSDKPLDKISSTLNANKPDSYILNSHVMREGQHGMLYTRY